MSTDHDQLRELLGPYVLGGLDNADRALLDGHLGTCAACRDELVGYAGLPSLLRLGDGPTQSPSARVDDRGLSRALVAARRERRRRQRRTLWGVAAAVGLVLGLGATTAALVAAQPEEPGTSASAQRLVAATGSPAGGETTLEARPWGTSINLDLTSLPQGQRFVVWVISTDGSREQAATWASTAEGVAHVTGASAVASTDVAEVRVSTAEGTLVLSADI